MSGREGETPRSDHPSGALGALPAAPRQAPSIVDPDTGPGQEKGATARRGRPSEGRPVQVRIPDDLLDAVDLAAADRGISRAEMMRRILCTWVRFRGGTWRPVLTPEQWATYHRETM